MARDKEREDALNQVARRIAGMLQECMPEGVGFTLFLFEMGDVEGFLSYVSNAQRDDMIKVIDEWVTLQKALRKEPGHV